MLKGTPALQLTNEHLISNALNVKIDWENIEFVDLSGPKKSVLSIKLKDCDKFYSNLNPVKRKVLKALFLLDKGDITINLEVVKGDNKKIASIANLYHQNQILYHSPNSR